MGIYQRMSLIFVRSLRSGHALGQRMGAVRKVLSVLAANFDIKHLVAHEETELPDVSARSAGSGMVS